MCKSARDVTVNVARMQDFDAARSGGAPEGEGRPSGLSEIRCRVHSPIAGALLLFWTLSLLRGTLHCVQKQSCPLSLQHGTAAPVSCLHQVFHKWTRYCFISETSKSSSHLSCVYCSP
jgi:hypothetical protein